MSFLDALIRIWNTFFHLIWFSNKSITNKLFVYIKSNTGNTVSVQLDPKWDIKNVKEVVAPKLGLEPEELKIILAGKELNDTIVIEECDLGERSILHAVKSKKNRRSEGSKPLNETITDLSLTEVINEHEDEHLEVKPHFFVYCSSPCGEIRTGKLRVRCSSCKSGAITVDSDPASWSDVLNPQKISGCCEQLGCEAGPVAWVQFFFKCSEHTSTGESDQAVPLPLIRSNYKHVPCLACTEICDRVLVFECEHVTCLECFAHYCTVRISERQFVLDPKEGYTLPCPANCPNTLINEPHHFRVLPKNLYEQYQRFGAEEYVLKSGGVLCPQPGCGAGIMPDEECLDRITCINGCGFVFCRKCLQGYHMGDCEAVEESQSAQLDYTLDPDRVHQARWDEASKVAIKVTTKPCPQCRTPTERAGGCMHIVCTRCSLEWCWVCQMAWTRDCMGSHWFG